MLVKRLVLAVSTVVAFSMLGVATAEPSAQEAGSVVLAER